MTPEERIIAAIRDVLYEAGVPHRVVRDLKAIVQRELNEIERRDREALDQQVETDVA
jgi:hypothetical protein